MAEKSGFIVPLSDWVLKRACTYINQLSQSQKFADLRSVAVNLSAKYFHQADFESRVQQILDETGVDPSYLEMELTEGTLLSNADDAINKICRLQQIGIQFSIDDFGTGYSSLAYIKKLPIDRIKIDRCFVRDVDSSPDDAAIVGVIITMANHFNMAVIAEGVEVKSELDFLCNLGCNEFQGYYFYKPMPFQQFLQI
ncbi:MAG: EAL domain-containing protein [Motiliproteus sp.]|nr:EAL domain-containing protein [Motiliproteus sp.]MCW9052779.1 EAL domain-containing protein [Motiliproteus sp.]